jgi:ribosomal protein L6P/L9E
VRDQISGVIAESRPDNQYIFISGKDRKQVNDTAHDIFRYKKSAR